ncbi:efflux transporter periplasmic adaptor subunit [Opitutaceae bacterium EW11]|nr:efflux transporter periplasmic adaptor subunit [Opitutaceae bacterium EW11]
MKTRTVLIVVAALAVLAALVGIKIMLVKKAMAGMAAARPPAPAVSTTKAKRETWNESLQSVATLRSFQGITVSTEVTGTVSQVAFASGAEVKAGDLLVELDASTEQAQLESLEAAAALADINLGRARELREKSTNTQADLDQAIAVQKQNGAAVKQIRAVIAKKRITAPFSGRLGIKQVDVGQYVSPGTAIVMLEAVDPIYADFGVPQQELGSIAPGMKATLRVDAFRERDFNGEVEAINPRVSDQTRNVRLRAQFGNSDAALRPGMFGTVVLNLATKSEALVLPLTAVVYSTYGDFVYVVSKGEGGEPMVHQQFVTLGTKRGDFIQILKGLNDGDEVVTSGQIKLRNNIPIRVNNSVQPAASESPKPVET